MRQSVGSRRLRHDLATKQQTGKGGGKGRGGASSAGEPRAQGSEAGLSGAPRVSLCLQRRHAGARGVRGPQEGGGPRRGRLGRRLQGSASGRAALSGLDPASARRAALGEALDCKPWQPSCRSLGSSILCSSPRVAERCLQNGRPDASL